MLTCNCLECWWHKLVYLPDIYLLFWLLFLVAFWCHSKWSIFLKSQHLEVIKRVRTGLRFGRRPLKFMADHNAGILGSTQRISCKWQNQMANLKNSHKNCGGMFFSYLDILSWKNTQIPSFFHLKAVNMVMGKVVKYSSKPMSAVRWSVPMVIVAKPAAGDKFAKWQDVQKSYGRCSFFLDFKIPFEVFFFFFSILDFILPFETLHWTFLSTTRFCKMNPHLKWHRSHKTAE